MTTRHHKVQGQLANKEHMITPKSGSLPGGQGSFSPRVNLTYTRPFGTFLNDWKRHIRGGPELTYCMGLTQTGRWYLLHHFQILQPGHLLYQKTSHLFKKNKKKNKSDQCKREPSTGCLLYMPRPRISCSQTRDHTPS